MGTLKHEMTLVTFLIAEKTLPSENIVMEGLSFPFVIQDSTDPSSTLPQWIN